MEPGLLDFPGSYFKNNDMKYRKGDICRVVGDRSGHKFPIGTIVKILSRDREVNPFLYGYEVQAGSVIWYVYETDLEPTTKSGLLHYISLQIKSFILKLRG